MVLPPDDSTDPLPEPPELPALFAPAFAAACWALWAALDCLSAHSPFAIFSFSLVALLLNSCWRRVS